MNDWQKEDASDGLKYIAKICIIGLLLILIIGLIAIGYRYVFGTAEKKVDREIFKNSSQYIEGYVKDLNAYKQEYDKYIREDDKEGAKAVISYIKDDFADFPVNKIKNKNLREFLEGVFDGEYDD